MVCLASDRYFTNENGLLAYGKNDLQTRLSSEKLCPRYKSAWLVNWLLYAFLVGFRLHEVSIFQNQESLIVFRVSFVMNGDSFLQNSSTSGVLFHESRVLWFGLFRLCEQSI